MEAPLKQILQPLKAYSGAVRQKIKGTLQRANSQRAKHHHQQQHLRTVNTERARKSAGGPKNELVLAKGGECE